MRARRDVNPSSVSVPQPVQTLVTTASAVSKTTKSAWARSLAIAAASTDTVGALLNSVRQTIALLVSVTAAPTLLRPRWEQDQALRLHLPS